MEPWLRLSVNQSPASHRAVMFGPKTVGVRSVVDKVALEQVSLHVLSLFPVGAILPLLHAHRLSRALFNLAMDSAAK